jgi:hypothetical protein
VRQSQRSRNILALGQPRVVKLDPKGSLALIVGSELKHNGPRKFLVSPDALSQLSPAWRDIVARQMPTGSWRLRFGPVKVHLTEDDPDMLLLLLKIAHLQFQGFDHLELEYHQLLELALICRRYDTNKVLGPFLGKWTDPYRQIIFNHGMEEWMYVAWQFGFEDDYLLLARHFALDCTIDTDLQLIAPSGKPLHGWFPPGAVGKLLIQVPFLVLDYSHLLHLSLIKTSARIEKARWDLLQLLLHTTYQLVKNMIVKNTCQCNSNCTSPKTENPISSIPFPRLAPTTGTGPYPRFHSLPPYLSLSCMRN